MWLPISFIFLTRFVAAAVLFLFFLIDISSSFFFFFFLFELQSGRDSKMKVQFKALGRKGETN